MNITTTLYTDPSGFDALAGEWNALLRRSATNTLFLTREWQKVWWQILGDGALRLMAWRDPAGALIGMAPLFFAAGEPGPAEIAFVGCREVSDYLDFIFDRQHESACYRALVEELASPACPEWNALSLCNIPETSPTLTLLPELARERGWSAEVRFEDVCPIIPLPDTFDAYLATLDGRERRELQRKMRRAGAEARLAFADSAATLDRDMDDFIRLMTASMPGKASFMTPRMASFFRAMARAMLEAGWLQLSFLEVDGARAATYLNFARDDSVLVYNSGLDPTQFAFLSPGQVLLGRLIERAIQERRRAFDFLQGNEEYKHKLGGQDLKLFTLYINR